MATPFERLDRHDRLREPPVEALLPGDVRADARHEPEGHHLELAAQRLVRLPRRVDLGDHRLAGARVQRAHGRLVHALEVRRRSSAVAARAPSTVPMRVTCERTSTPSARRNALASAPAATRAAVSRADARSSTLRTSVWPNFWIPARSAWPGPRKVDLLDLRLHRPGVHPLLPVLVVAVLDPQRHRAAERAPVANPRRHLSAVLLDLHAAAAAVAELAPGEVAVDVLGAQLEAGRQALDDGGEPRTVGFARGYEAERHGAHTLRTRVRAPGWRRDCWEGTAC